MANDFYKQLLNQSPMGYAYHRLICDQKGLPIDYEFIEINDMFEKLTGLKADEIIGKKITEILPGILNDDFDWIKFYGDVALQGTEKELEQFSNLLNKFYRVNVFSPERGYFVTTFVDITKEREQFEELNGFFEVNLDLLCIADLEGNFLKVNKSWESTLGYSVEELTNRKFLEFVHPDDIPSTLEVMSKLACNENDTNFINRYRSKDGTYKFIEWSSQPNGKLIYAAARDITDKVRAEQGLLAEKKRYELAMEGSNDGFWDWDILTNELYLSPRWKLQLGYRDDEISNEFSSFESLIFEEDSEKVRNQVAKYLDAEIMTYDISFRMVHKDRSLRHIRARGEALRDGDGKPFRMAGSHTDITLQVEQESALKEKEQNFASFFETIDDLLMVGDSKGNLLYANSATIEKLGYSFEELSQMHILDLHPKIKRREAEQIFSDMFEGKRDNCPLPLQTKNGVLLPVETRVWFGSWNNEPCIFGVVKDLSIKEAALDKFHKLFDNNPALMAITSLEDHKFKEVNDAFCSTLGYEKSEIIGKTALELDLFNEPEKHIEVGEMLRKTGKIQNVELKVKSKSGQIMTGLFAGEVIDNQLEKSFLTVMIDISKRKEDEQELIIAKAKAEASNNAKSQFLANMSHEIRTPMNGMIGGLQLLEMTGLTKEQSELVEMSRKSSASLLNIVNDILDYSRIEVNKIAYESIEFKLSELLDDLQALFTLSIRDKRLRFYSGVGYRVPEYVKGDPFRIKQILTNLIGNAVKFTQSGEIKLIIDCINDPNDQVLDIEFRVHDTGIGISEEYIESVFDRFSQSDSSNTRTFGGTGLGLAICKGLVEQMNGEIKIESQIGVGTIISFVLPLEKIKGHANSIEQNNLINSSHSISEISILVAEDDDISGLLLKKIAARKGWNVEICKNGVKAVEMYSERSFDIVLMDVQMPELDGYKATEQIRRLENIKKTRTPIIAMTANALSGDKDKCLANGMDDYLSKPVDFNEFYKMMEKWIKR